MKKRIPIIISICCILVLISSCRKKNDSREERVGIVQNLISAESKGSQNPLVVVPSPQKNEKTEKENETVSDQSSSSGITEGDESLNSSSFAETADSVDSDPVVLKENQAQALISPEVPEGKELPGVETNNDRGENEAPGYSLPILEIKPYTYKGYTSDVEIGRSSTTLTVPEVVSEDDIDALAVIFSRKFPLEASSVTYTYDNNTVTLSYPEESEEYILSALDAIEAQVRSVIDRFPINEKAEFEDFTLEPVSVSEVAADSDASLRQTPEAKETSFTNSEDNQTASVFSLSLYGGGSWSFMKDIEKPYSFSAGLLLDVAVSSRWSIGIKAQYDISSYVKAGAHVSWKAVDFSRWDLYLKGGLGAQFAFSGEERAAVLLYAGTRLDYKISSAFSFFTEVGASWSPSFKGLEGTIALGAGYNF